ncbi:DNA polymerase domain-containing protein [Thermogladius sp. 4427co]|uniref:DNA polymerase domain-containing protein n=1 Tax=Thermogladius sp. 4427co TaxID=3450718 RepID=UPI003F79ED87
MGREAIAGEMPSLWLLDVYPGPREGVVLELYDEGVGVFRKVEASILYYGYIYSKDPYTIARELLHEGLVEDAWVDKWLDPPYYTEARELVVFATKSYRILRSILKNAEKHGLKPVNKYPHPLIEALYRAGLRPLSIVRKEKGRYTVLPWDPKNRDPILKSVSIGVRNSAYIVEEEGGEKRFLEIKDVITYLVSEKPVIAFTEPGIYLKLVQEDPAVRERVWKWVLGGSFSSYEYFEWSRISYTPLSLMDNISIGRILTTIEALVSRELRYMIRDGEGRHEEFREISDLLLFDRGGVVFKPRPGLYWNVCQLDFKSLYPSIISRLNISGETVNNPSCLNKTYLEYAGKEICLDRRGVIPLSIETLLRLKDLYEDLYKSTGDRLYDKRKAAIKWVLVASFGYLGYRNSLFGSIMAHETVTATSREIMRKASEEVSRKGFRIIHVLVDSLFISSVPDPRYCGEIADSIYHATGYRVKVESFYTWLYIPREFNSERGVANRYYGLLEDGSLKLKGVMAVRSDTPEFIRRAQLDALEKLARARDPVRFRRALLEAFETIEYYKRILLEGVDTRLLTIVRNPRRRGGYRKPPGYISGSNGPPYMLIASKKGLVSYDRLFNTGDIDLNYYLGLLEKAKKELPTPLDLPDNIVPQSLSGFI